MEEFDLMAEGSALERRKKLVETMMKQTQEAEARTSTQENGGILTVIGDLLRKRKAEGMSKQLDADTSAYQQKYGEQLNRELGSYLDTRQGRPATGNELPDGQVGPAIPQPAIQADPRKAVMQALASRLPELQKMGQTEFSQLGKQAEVKQHVVGDALIASDGVNPGKVLYKGEPKPKDQWSDIMQVGTGPDGKPIMGQRNTATGQIHQIGANGQTINIDTKGEGFALQEAGKVLQGARQQMITAQNQIDAATRVYELSKDPQLISGTFAEPTMFLSALGSKLGLNGPDAAAKTQAMMTDLAANALARGQEMKGSFSDADIKFLKEASAGSINLTPEVMRQIAALSFAASHNTILEANKQFDSASSIPGVDPIARLFPRPALRYQNIDPERLKDDEQTGRMKYISPLTSPSAAQPKGPKRISMADFLGS